MIQLQHKFDEYGRLVVYLDDEEEKAELCWLVALRSAWEALNRKPDFTEPGKLHIWNNVPLGDKTGEIRSHKSTTRGSWHVDFIEYGEHRWSHDVIHGTDLEYEVSEHMCANSEFSYDGEHSDFEILDWPESGTDEPKLIAYYHYNMYAIRSWLDDLLNNGEAVFQNGAMS